MRQKMKYNKKQIEEAIASWSAYMLENKMINENELRQIIGESWFKKMKSGISGVFKNIAAGTKEAAEAIHDFVKPNKGAQQMIDALQKLKQYKSKNKEQQIKFDDVNLYAKLGDAEALPIVGFDNVKKKYLVLLVNPSNASAQPVKIRDLMQYVVPEFNVKKNHKITDYVQSIVCAKVNDAVESHLDESEMLFESKLSDYIKANKLTKKTALDAKHIAALKKLTKSSDEKVKKSIEKYFDTSSKPKKTSTPKKSTKKSVKTPKSSKKKTSSPKDPKSGAPSHKPPSDVDISPDSDMDIDKTPTEKKNKPAITMLDNKLLGVSPKQNSLGFVFSKSKKEIQIDDAFEL